MQLWQKYAILSHCIQVSIHFLFKLCISQNLTKVQLYLNICQGIACWRKSQYVR